MLEEVKEICPATTLSMAHEGALLVDVRERGEVNALAFDVPNLVNIPLSELEHRWDELPKDRELVMLCQRGRRSLRATLFLQHQGHTRVSNMEGGILKWVHEGFPVKGELAGTDACTPVCCGSEAVNKTNCC